MNGPHPHIVVGLDGSPVAERALAWAVDYANATGGSLHLVAAWDWPTFEGAPIVYGDYDPRKWAKEMLKRATETTGLPADRVTRTVQKGSAAQVLLEAAKNADLLVVGSHGHGGFTGMLLGSVSAHCVQHAHCPVMVVRERPDAIEARKVS